ncbi:hypothetical protein N0B31_07525 [Salinirubellus salinus]|jgi:hypothetical protein|uniref:Uncharacterized protein n=1 Tax=Salinirubellus salinus TaxID=1364945 RepID=A0A9E7UCD4_9EURY|nr:hypothetical protein [Salinirubellus salinus]UWM56132.1 hypothetical protein N0B31_07525 [Salinirubellus salinus]
MARSPHLVTERDELKLEVAVGTTRRRFELSDRAENLLRDEGYGPADVVPFVTAKALVLAGGATLPEKSDERDTAWELGGADGGRQVTRTEREVLAEYLRGVTVPDRSLDALREHVRKHDLPVDPTEVTGRAEKVGGLSDIARNL